MLFCMHNNLSGSRLDIIVAHSHAISKQNSSIGPIQEVLQVYEFERCCTTINNGILGMLFEWEVSFKQVMDLLTDATLF